MDREITTGLRALAATGRWDLLVNLLQVTRLPRSAFNQLQAVLHQQSFRWAWWRARDGTMTPIANLKDDHLVNILQCLDRDPRLCYGRDVHGRQLQLSKQTVDALRYEAELRRLS